MVVAQSEHDPGEHQMKKRRQNGGKPQTIGKKGQPGREAERHASKINCTEAKQPVGPVPLRLHFAAELVLELVYAALPSIEKDGMMHGKRIRRMVLFELAIE